MNGGARSPQASQNEDFGLLEDYTTPYIWCSPQALHGGPLPSTNMESTNNLTATPFVDPPGSVAVQDDKTVAAMDVLAPAIGEA